MARFSVTLKLYLICTRNYIISEPVKTAGLRIDGLCNEI